MSSAEFRERTVEELTALESDLRKKLWKARFDNHANRLDDTSTIQKTRRELARLKTILTERSAKSPK